MHRLTILRISDLSLAGLLIVVLAAFGLILVFWAIVGKGRNAGINSPRSDPL